MSRLPFPKRILAASILILFVISIYFGFNISNLAFLILCFVTFLVFEIVISIFYKKRK